MTKKTLNKLVEIYNMVDEFYNCEDDLSYDDNSDLRDILLLLEQMYNRALQEENK